MSLMARCPRCREQLVHGAPVDACPVHGALSPLWLPGESTYDEFVEHLRVAGSFPTYLPWPLGPGWAVTEFGVVADPSAHAVGTLTCCSGSTEPDGPVDVFVVTEEVGVGLGARCAGLAHDDPGPEVGAGPAPVRVRLEGKAVPLWPVSTSRSDHEFDRSVFAGEALGRWLWIVLRPASAMLLLRDDWILRDVSGMGPPLVEMPFGGPRPTW
ncbi:MAG: DUF6758 family protein [Nocardioides sp.]